MSYMSGLECFEHYKQYSDTVLTDVMYISTFVWWLYLHTITYIHTGTHLHTLLPTYPHTNIYYAYILLTLTHTLLPIYNHLHTKTSTYTNHIRLPPYTPNLTQLHTPPHTHRYADIHSSCHPYLNVHLPTYIPS